jgi:hypothetical protein
MASTFLGWLTVGFAELVLTVFVERASTAVKLRPVSRSTNTTPLKVVLPIGIFLFKGFRG